MQMFRFWEFVIKYIKFEQGKVEKQNFKQKNWVVCFPLDKLNRTVSDFFYNRQPLLKRGEKSIMNVLFLGVYV